MTEDAANYYAETYDQSVPDWPGEIFFYHELAQEAKRRREGVLEVACGTGRITIRLARSGVDIVGLDLSPHMLAVARGKSADLPTIRWVEGDMRSFALGRMFGLVIIPGHSLQNLNTAADQASCLQCIRRHLEPRGLLVLHLDHQDVGWLADLVRGRGGVFEPGEEFRHPQTGQRVVASRAWWYEPSTQTAIAQTVWEEFDADGRIVGRRQSEPRRLHCVFRFEVEHLLARTGFKVEAVYGDFFKQTLRDDSSEMIWVARAP